MTWKEVYGKTDQVFTSLHEDRLSESELKIKFYLSLLNLVSCVKDSNFGDLATYRQKVRMYPEYDMVPWWREHIVGTLYGYAFTTILYLVQLNRDSFPVLLTNDAEDMKREVGEYLSTASDLVEWDSSEVMSLLVELLSSAREEYFYESALGYLSVLLSARAGMDEVLLSGFKMLDYGIRTKRDLTEII